MAGHIAVSGILTTSRFLAVTKCCDLVRHYNSLFTSVRDRIPKRF